MNLEQNKQNKYDWNVVLRYLIYHNRGENRHYIPISPKSLTLGSKT